MTDAPRERPLSPHTSIWRWHLTMATSILHRASGCALYGGGLILAIWAMTLAAGPEAYGTVENRIHRSDDSEQHLRRANIGCRALAADVLLARLQRQPVGAIAARIHRNADEAAGKAPLVFVSSGHIGRVRAAVAHRHAVTLHGPDRDIRAHLTGWFQKRER